LETNGDDDDVKRFQKLMDQGFYESYPSGENNGKKLMSRRPTTVVLDPCPMRNLLHLDS
uniref:RNA-dependent RNA polymerase n=1 Tax=Angiostrongylus cantonensis TaxID=6313 RepID=A0A0K0D5K4_ANGCA